MSESIRTIIRLNPDMKPGDVFVLNAPFNGGTHLPDVTVITPVFDEAGKDALFYVASRGHHADIGGKTPGSAPPDSTHIEDEGVLIDNFKMIDGGHFREAETRALLASGEYPCRNIDENMADLAAQVAANETGVREIQQDDPPVRPRRSSMPTWATSRTTPRNACAASSPHSRTATTTTNSTTASSSASPSGSTHENRGRDRLHRHRRQAIPSTTTRRSRSATRWCCMCSARSSARTFR
jgi:hypothetical protein